MLKKISLLLVSFVFIGNLSAQEKKKRKTIKTTRVTNAPKIDGILNDEAWKKC